MQEELDYSNFYQPESNSELPDQMEEGEEGEYEEEATEDEGTEGFEEEETEGEEEAEGMESDDQGPTRSPEETQKLAAEFYGVNPQDISVMKDGSFGIIKKINGRKVLVTPEQYQKGFGLEQAGYEKLNEGKRLIKGFYGYMDQVKKNPKMIWGLADQLGLNKEELAAEYLQDIVDEREMSPEERERKELKRKVDEFNRKEQEAKRKAELDKFEAERAQERDRIGHELVEAMVNEGFKKADTAKNSNIMYSALMKLQADNYAGGNMSPAQAVKIAKREFRENIMGTLGDIDENHIINVLPDSVIDLIRKADISNIRRGKPTPKIGQQVELEDYEDDNEPVRQKGRRKQNISDYFDNL